VTAHGGDVWSAAQELGIPASELLDFSANINPRGLPRRARERLRQDASDALLLSFYPDPSARALRMALSERLDVPLEAILVGPGAEALLSPALRCLQAKRALVPVPAFSEYRRVCAQEDVGFVPFPLDASNGFRLPVDRCCRTLEAEGCDAVFLNQPHNPSGAYLEPNEVRHILDAGTGMILDEAFIDYVPEMSLTREAASRPRLLVIRSLTKFYGSPALRAGYAVAHPDTIRRIAAFVPTWPVTQLAIDAFAQAVADCEYAEASRTENALERERLSTALRTLGLVVFPSAANFLLLDLPAALRPAAELRTKLLREHRILIRNCDSYEGLESGRYIRVAVRSASDNQRLIHALR
jgi:threonine-phosphate decarboxylase